MYFSGFGGKLDNTHNISWVVLFIPIYIIEFPLLIYSFIHYFYLTKINVSKSLAGITTFGTICKC